MTFRGPDLSLGMKEHGDESEALTVLPICWQADALLRLNRAVDLKDLRAHRSKLKLSIKDDIRRLEAQCRKEAMDLREDAQVYHTMMLRKHVDHLLERVENFGNSLESSD